MCEYSFPERHFTGRIVYEAAGWLYERGWGATSMQTEEELVRALSSPPGAGTWHLTLVTDDTHSQEVTQFPQILDVKLR